MKMLFKLLKWPFKLIFLALALYGVGHVRYQGMPISTHVSQWAFSQCPTIKRTAKTEKILTPKEAITASEEKRIEEIINTKGQK